jgi:hypothetical protein
MHSSYIRLNLLYCRLYPPCLIFIEPFLQTSLDLSLCQNVFQFVCQFLCSAVENYQFITATSQPGFAVYKIGIMPAGDLLKIPDHSVIEVSIFLYIQVL